MHLSPMHVNMFSSNCSAVVHGLRSISMPLQAFEKKVQLATTRIDKKGHMVVDGASKQLKNSQHYTEFFGHALHAVYQSNQDQLIAESAAARRRLDQKVSEWRRVVPCSSNLSKECPWFKFARLEQVLEYLG